MTFIPKGRLFKALVANVLENKTAFFPYFII